MPKPKIDREIEECCDDLGGTTKSENDAAQAYIAKLAEHHRRLKRRRELGEVNFADLVIEIAED